MNSDFPQDKSKEKLEETHSKNETMLGSGQPCVEGNLDVTNIKGNDCIEGSVETNLSSGKTCTEHPADLPPKYV